MIAALLELQCPTSQWIDGTLHSDGEVGRVEHGAGAVSEQHAQVPIATFGDAPDTTGLTGGVFPGCADTHTT